MNEILEKINEALKSNFDDVFNSLQLGATDDELELLKKCLPNNEIPKELEILYKWHNGQTGSYSLNQDDNRTFLPIDEVIDAWEFLNDPMEEIQEPWSKSWLPILYNGAGDYVVFETEGTNQGKLISYWHDDEDRDIEHENLEIWLQEVLKYAKV